MPLSHKYFQASITLFKFVAIAMIFYLISIDWWDRFVADIDEMLWIESWQFIALSLTTAALSITSIFILPFINCWLIRIPISIIYLFGAGIDHVIFDISGNHLTDFMSEIIISNTDMAYGALCTFSNSITSTGIPLLFITAAYCLPPIKKTTFPSMDAAIPLLALMLAFTLSMTYDKDLDLPTPNKVPSQLLKAALSTKNSPNSFARKSVDYKLDLSPKIRKIVVVIDEAIRGDYLGVNNSKYNNTPFLSSHTDHIANYGVAISGSNCSHSSRYLMRTGLPKKDIPCLDNKIHQLPTIWQYAKFARFKSILIDTRYKYGHQQEYMSAEESLQIDEYIAILDRPYFRREILAADKLLQTLQRDEAMFIYLNKQGSHQPYEMNFPADLAYDPISLVSNSVLPKSKREAIRDYHKAMKFCVDGFFQKVIPELGDDTVLIYTSDHGQALFDGDYDWGHCSETSAVLGEGQVPIIVVTGSRDLSNQFKEEASRAYNHASHFELFPTILELMGFSRDWIENRYGNGLLNISIAQKRSFWMGEIFSSKGSWVEAGD